MLKHSIAVAALLLGAADALQTMKISSDASGMSRRDAIIGVAPAAFFGFGLSQGASPAFALRSVLDDGSQQLFDEKQAKRNAPPPPPKTMQEMLGFEGKPGQEDAKFERPKFERKAQKDAREAAEKAAEEAGLNKPEAPKPQRKVTQAQIQAQKEADEAAERAAAALAKRRAAGLSN